MFFPVHFWNFSISSILDVIFHQKFFFGILRGFLAGSMLMFYELAITLGILRAAGLEF